MEKIEILSPAGSPDSLLAAVRAGADAVYLGASAFSARAAAKNFDDDALRQAAEFCHARGVKVYLAVNTLILQDELPQALALIQYACSLPVDALIVQDMGLVRLLRRCAPSLRLNASTQMSVTSPAGVRALAALGVSRVVLARELSLREIAEIRRGAGNRPIELEVFVHGALCMSVSGQCYFSSVLGSRSGNRGMCAQPCRLPFSVPGGTGHDLSLKDLSMIARIGELKSAGADSAKIEGRMKRPEYVAAATAACRLSADGEAVPPELTHNLSAVFSRSGFTTGYPDGRLGRDMFGIRSKEDVTGATKAVFSGLHELYREESPAVPVWFSLRVCAGEPVTLTARDEEGRLARASLLIPPEPAAHRAVDEARCAEQLRKTGGTPFFARDIRCEIGEGLALPVSRLNRLRRDVLEQLEMLRSHREPVPFSSPAPGDLFPGPHHAGPMRLRARFQTAGSVPDCARACELIYLPVSAPEQDFVSLGGRGFSVAAELPRGIFGTEDALRKKLERLNELGFSGVWAGTIGAAALGREAGMTVHGGFSLNLVNTPALEWAREFGLADTELSFELTLEKAAALGGDLPRGLVLYGRLPLMLCRNCPGANAPGGCAKCGKNARLTDRRGTEFPILCGNGCSEVLNSVPLYMADRIDEIRSQDFGVLRFSVENSVEIEEIFRNYLALSPVEKPKGQWTRGLYYRGIE